MKEAASDGTVEDDIRDEVSVMFHVRKLEYDPMGS